MRQWHKHQSCGVRWLLACDLYFVSVFPYWLKHEAANHPALLHTHSPTPTPPYSYTHTPTHIYTHFKRCRFVRSSGEQVLGQLMPPGGPSKSRGGGPAGRCFCACLLPCSCPHCCQEEVGGEQGAEVSTAIGHEYGHRCWNRVTATVTAFNAIVGVDYYTTTWTVC